jgi:hypothetical protein
MTSVVDFDFEYVRPHGLLEVLKGQPFRIGCTDGKDSCTHQHALSDKLSSRNAPFEEEVVTHAC